MTTQTDIPHRQRWMGILARASREALEKAWESLDLRPAYTVLRRPETGLVMVRGRTCGSGAPFNLGEMTVTRCAVESGGNVGHAYVAGRDGRHALLAALFDALLQDADLNHALEQGLVAPLESLQHEQRTRERSRTDTTRVDFFTMVRGED